MLVDSEIGFDQCILCNVVSLIPVAAAEGEKEPPERLLFSSNQRYKSLPVHSFVCMCFNSASISCFRAFFPTK